MTTTNVGVKFSADTRGYTAGVSKATAATVGLRGAVQSTARPMAGLGASGAKLGRGLAGVGVAMSAMAISKAVIGSVLEFDSAFVGVTKTVDGTDAQLAELRQGILDMSKVLPASAVEIANVAEAGGQLGIALPNLREFTKVMIDLGETTNLTSDQAATSLARFVNVTGSSQDTFSNLASAIVDLGNKGVTTESEITEMGTRIAAAGSIAGFADAEILSLASALSSVGVEAEAGGSSASRVLLDINSAVISGSDDLEVFAETAGTTAEEFAATWRANPAQAMTEFIEGLGRVKDEGGDINTLLDSVGFGGIIVSRSLQSLATAEGLLAEQLDIGTTAYTENTAATKEAETRYASAAAQISIFGNNIKAFAIETGQQLLPPFVDLMGDLIDKFGELEGVADALGTQFGPAFENIVDALVEIVDVAGQIGGSLARVFGPVLIAAVVITAKGIEQVAGALESVVGWVSESEAAITLMTFAIGVKLVAAAVAATHALLFMGGTAVSAGILNVSTAIKGAYTNLLSFATLARTAPMAALGTVAGAAGLVGLTVALFGVQRAFSDTKEEAEEMIAALTADVDPTSLEGVITGVHRLNSEMASLAETGLDQGWWGRTGSVLQEFGAGAVNFAGGWAGVNVDVADSYLDIKAGIEAAKSAKDELEGGFAASFGETADFDTVAAALQNVAVEYGSTRSVVETGGPLWTSLFEADQDVVDGLTDALADAARLGNIDLSGMNVAEAEDEIRRVVLETKDLNAEQVTLHEILGAVGGEFETLSGKVENYGAALEAVFSPSRSMFDAQTDLARAFGEVDEAIAAGTTSMDPLTAEGLDNRDMWSGLTASVIDNAIATAEATQDFDAANLAMLDQRENLIQLATEFGMTRPAAEGLINSLGLFPEALSVAVSATGVALTKEQIAELVAGMEVFEDPTVVEIIGKDENLNTILDNTLGALAFISGDPTIAELDADDDEFQRIYTAVNEAMNIWGQKVATGELDADDYATDIVELALTALTEFDEQTPEATLGVDTDQADADLRSFSARVAAAMSVQPVAYVPGGGLWPPKELKPEADGGIVREAQIQNGSQAILWAEAGPEAYIPLDPAKRTRSVGILSQVANEFGMQVTPMVNGGLVGWTPHEVDALAENIERNEGQLRWDNGHGWGDPSTGERLPGWLRRYVDVESGIQRGTSLLHVAKLLGLVPSTAGPDEAFAALSAAGLVSGIGRNNPALHEIMSVRHAEHLNRRIDTGFTIGSAEEPGEVWLPSGKIAGPGKTTITTDTIKRIETTMREYAAGARGQEDYPGALFTQAEERRFRPHRDGPTYEQDRVETDFEEPRTDEEVDRAQRRYSGLNVGEIIGSEIALRQGGSVDWQAAKYQVGGRTGFLDDLVAAVSYASGDDMYRQMWPIPYDRARGYADWGFSIGQVQGAEIITGNRGEAFQDGTFEDRYGQTGSLLELARGANVWAGIPGVDRRSFSHTVVPFADGGIVTSATMGLVGEAGPEAIIPLDRFLPRDVKDRPADPVVDERRLATMIGVEVTAAVKRLPPPVITLDGRQVAKGTQSHLRTLSLEDQ